jgi:hypothetical protein
MLIVQILFTTETCAERLKVQTLFPETTLFKRPGAAARFKSLPSTGWKYYQNLQVQKIIDRSFSSKYEQLDEFY